MIPLNTKVYEVLSLAMRYFFACLGILIVWCSFSWLRKDRKQKHKRLKQLPDAGTIGILTVEAGSKDLRPGEIIPVPHEGVLGYLRTCDVVVPADEVAKAHLDFIFVDGKGLFIYPRRGCEAVVDGMHLTSRRDGSRCPMQHGSVLQVGQAMLRLGVFAGLNVQEAQYSTYAPAVESPEENDFMPESTDFGVPPDPYAPPTPQSDPWQGGDDDAS